MNTTETVRELNELRRGRGLNAADLSSRVGPRLRRACAIAESDGPAALRRKIVLRLTEVAEKLPEDLRLAANVALALHEEADGEFLDRRIAWLAGHYERDPRTARRRVDTAFRLLSEHLDDERALAQPDLADEPDGWYVESLKAVLRMDLDPPQLFEERRIVATADGLDRLVVSLRAPRGRAAERDELVGATMIHGGHIVESTQLAPGHTRFVIGLPEPLRLGQRHEYGVQFSSYPRSWLHPYDLLAPLHRCEHFAIRVRFGGATQPDLVWQLRRQGMSYGLQWSA